jgi:RNA polymerase sigma factor (sigma-70 family)
METRPTLIGRLRDSDNPKDWEDFYLQYADMILRYTYKLGLDEASAKDVLQETMVALMSILKRFDYDPKKGKFRSYLFTVVRRSSFRSIKRQQRRNEVSVNVKHADSDTEWIDALASETDESVVDHDELRWRQSILEQCLENLKADPKLSDETIDIFIAYAVEAGEVQEVADRFNTSTNNVYQIKNRLIKRLQSELSVLFPDEDQRDG